MHSSAGRELSGCRSRRQTNTDCRDRGQGRGAGAAAEALTRWSRRSRRTLDDARRELVTLDGCGEAAITAVALVTLWRTKEEEEPHESHREN